MRKRARSYPSRSKEQGARFEHWQQLWQGWDTQLIWAALLLLGLGLVLVYSSSSALALRRHNDAAFFLHEQSIRALLGIIAMVIAAVVPRPWLQRRAGWWFGLGLLLCGLVLIPGIGRVAGGARRWLDVAGVGLQPSEFVKLATVVVLAALLARRHERPSAQRSSLWIPLALVQIPVALILLEPDLGSAVLLEGIACVMVFMAGLRFRALAVLALATLPVLYHLVVSTPFRLRRLLSFLDPWAYREGSGYQVTEGLIAMGSGGLTGVGLGESKHKLFFLPEAHTDFVFAILGEELGYVGVCITLLGFAWLLWRCLLTAQRTGNTFDAYLAVGLTALLGLAVVLNLWVVTGMLPTKGLPLPLLSYGGSHLLATFIALGLLIRVGRQARTVAV